MSKKRLRVEASLPRAARRAVSKQDPNYWRRRLFKCRYTYKGKHIEVRNWSVKIQHLGRRKTFGLSSRRRGQAAAEACALYRKLVTEGWTGVASPGGGGGAQADSGLAAQALPAPDAEKLDINYWAQRLIHREHTMDAYPRAPRELSVRMDCAGSGYYFPLGTDDRPLAAARALGTYQSIVNHGWEMANRQVSRELTVAFRWLDIPLAWTYTTIHTQPGFLQRGPAETSSGSADAVLVSLTESDAGIRNALEWCVDHTEGFRCPAAYGTAAEAIQESPRRRVHLALVNYSLPDKPGAVCLAEMKAAVPEMVGLLYSVYEDSEELFRTTPGGAGTYLLRRTPSTQFLAPIAGRLKLGRLRAEEMPAAAWQYFKDSLASLPVGPSGRKLASLTQREHEVLALLSKGHSDKDIADRLGISIYTVHEHVRKVLDKLGAHNRTEAAVMFLQK